MKKLFRGWFLSCVLAAALAGVGCSVPGPAGTAGLQADAGTAMIRPGVVVRLPGRHGIEPAVFHQLLAVSYEGNTDTLQAVLETGEDRISLAGLTPMGVRLFSVVLEGGRVQASQLPAAGRRLPPANQVLLDIMLSFCPLGAWELPPGYVLLDESPRLRTLRGPDGGPVYEILYTDAGGRRLPSVLRHLVLGYSLGMEYLSVSAPGGAAPPTGEP